MKLSFGLLALVVGTPAFLPQVYKVYTTGHTESFSSRTLILYTMAQVCWILHSYINIHDNNLLIAATINMTCFLYIIYKKHMNDELIRIESLDQILSWISD